MVNGDKDKNGNPVIKFNSRELKLIYSMLTAVVIMCVAAGTVLIQNAVEHAEFRLEIKALKQDQAEICADVDQQQQLLWRIIATQGAIEGGVSLKKLP